ncbi:synaptogenesis protein syg-2-like [Strongylocentrotus purpuratus]|uniref:Ig-like domain-containing protein n=1 Tax=Strongylocentrotus purpuratus TaxID=7668 RepID=A0A7M7NCE5_STRPU|nr:synaptogenesis protein syg-2-like [Strongylocentrotus purpuratus]
MDERIRMFLFLTFIVSKTNEMSVYTRIQNPEILPVVAVPKLLSIMDVRFEDGYQNGASVSITSGRTHNLTCSVQDARPPAELEWDVPEEVQIRLDDQYNAVHGEAYTSKRVVSVNPSREDDGKILRCMASHRELDSGLQMFIRLDVQVSPTNLRITASDLMTIDEAGTRSVMVFEDLTTSFNCKSVGSRPKAVISWIIGSDYDLGRTTSTSTTNEADQGLRDTQSTLQLIPKRWHHKQLLRCVAYAGMNQRQTEVRVIVYDVKMTTPDDLRDGIETNVSCRAVNGYPAPLIHWYIGSRNVTHDSSLKASMNVDDSYDAESTLNLNPNRFYHVLPVVGENITLACIYTPPSTSRLLSWQDENGNILAIDKCQGVGCSNELNVPDVSKYSLRADSSSGNLTIRDLTLDDSGRYQCLVGTFSDAASDAIDLKVVLSAEPRLLSITDGRTETGYKNGESVSITSGRTHNLTCSVQDARPPAKLEWHIPEEVQVQLKDQYNAVHGDAYTSRRVVSVTPSRDDDGKVFRCVASHRELDNELQIFIQLDVQVPPNDLQLTAYGSIAINVTETRSVNVFEDSATSFTCNSVGSRPKAVISWIIGSDDDLGSTTSTSTTNEADQSLRDTKSILQLIPRRRHHNKLLRCVAHAGINQSHTEVRVIVFGPPDSPYLSGMGWLQDGVSSNMTCTSNNGYPAPTFQWYLGSKNVTKDSNTESSRNIDHRLDAMSVLNFTPTVDEDDSPAIVDYSVRRVYIGHHNVDAMLTCISESRPLASITWFLNGKELINGTRHHIHHSHPQEDTLSWFIITSVRSSSYLSNTSVTVSAEQPYDITCEAYGARPPSLLEWRIPDDVTVVRQDQSDVVRGKSYVSQNTVTITPSRNDQGKNLGCVASHPKLQNDLQRSVQLNVQATPSFLSITDDKSEDGYKNGSSVSIISGRTHNLTCSVRDAKPPAKLKWLIPEEVQARLEDQYNAVYGDAYTSRRVVSVTPCRDDDGKIFRCLASHRELYNELQMFIHLDVQVPPSDLRLTAYVSIATSPTETKSVIVFEHSATSFTCKSVGSRPSAVISWIIGSDDDLGSMTYTSTNNLADPGLRDTTSNLQLIPKRRHHNQFLRCVADTGMNQLQTEVRVIVHDYPVIVDYSVRRVSSGQKSVDAILTCTSDSRPLASITWFSNGAEINNSNRHQIHHSLLQEDTLRSSNLDISNISAEDDGNYTCSAETRLGNDSATITLSYSGCQRLEHIRATRDETPIEVDECQESTELAMRRRTTEFADLLHEEP